MTNYNERLDEILDDFFTIGTERHISELKQSITSLIKELVDEAKPEVNCIEHYKEIEQYLDQFEQNLLKELEEV